MTRFTAWGSAGIWLAAGATAFGLTLLAPNERSVMGQLPQLAAKARDQHLLALPQELPAERTLALLVFRRDQKEEVRSWIDGMRLGQDQSIPWLKVRVLPPEGAGRAAAPVAMAPDARPEHLLSVATNINEFAQAMVLSGTEHAQVVVLGRDGQVLAKAQGSFDVEKARALLETLRSE